MKGGVVPGAAEAVGGVGGRGGGVVREIAARGRGFGAGGGEGLGVGGC